MLDKLFFLVIIVINDSDNEERHEGVKSIVFFCNEYDDYVFLVC